MTVAVCGSVAGAAEGVEGKNHQVYSSQIAGTLTGITRIMLTDGWRGCSFSEDPEHGEP